MKSINDSRAFLDNNFLYAAPLPRARPVLVSPCSSLFISGPAVRRLRVCAETPRAGKEAERRYRSRAWKTDGYHPSLSEPPLADLGFHLLIVFDLGFWSARTDGLDRRAGAVRCPGIRASGFEGEGANQGDVSRPEQSGGRVTTTEKKRIARGRLSPTQEVTGGRRATMAQESGASAFSCGRGADCATAREPVRPREARSLRERAWV